MMRLRSPDGKLVRYGRWFAHVIPEFSRAVLPLAGKPIRYVEVGVFGGDSAHWICEHILTHTQSRGAGIDPYGPDGKRTPEQTAEIKEYARMRLEPWEKDGRWTWHYRPSRAVLSRWRGGRIDLLYLDGSHLAHDVLADFCLAWPHLSPGAIVILDDYSSAITKSHRVTPEACAAIDLAYGGLIEWLHVGPWQASLRVVDPARVRSRRGVVAWRDDGSRAAVAAFEQQVRGRLGIDR